MMARIKVTQVKSQIGRLQNQKRTMEALGLRKMNQTVEHEATPTIIEDDCFIGSRCIVVEGVRVRKEAVLGANVVLTKSTKIMDVTGPEEVIYTGEVPARSVVIPGTYTKKFPAGEYQVACALIIGKRKESTDKKVSLNDALRDHNVAV